MVRLKVTELSTHEDQGTAAVLSSFRKILYVLKREILSRSFALGEKGVVWSNSKFTEYIFIVGQIAQVGNLLE